MIPKNKQAKIEEFVARVRDAFGEKLESVILYGSAANGEFHEEYSDVNLLCVVRDTSFATLRAMSPIARWWQGERQPAPLLMTRGEIEHATDVFSIELMDMKQHHRVLFGADVISGLETPMDLHRVQVEYELREKLILLRQRAMLAGDDEKLLWELMLQSVASFATLCRHALIALHQPATTSRREAIKQVAALARFDADAFLQVLDVREHKTKPKELDAKQLFAHYLVAVEKLTVAVDEALDR